MLVASTERVPLEMFSLALAMISMERCLETVNPSSLLCMKNMRLLSSTPFTPVSQLVPLYPARQAQEKALCRFSQYPPLAQGSLSHSSRSIFRTDIQET